MAVTFDATNLIITLESANKTPDALSIYSDWKDWVKAGTGAGIVPAFDVVGGDPLDASTNAGSYFFFRNDLGWRIKPPEEHGEWVINGNFYARVSATPFRIQTTGSFNTSVDRNFSSLTQEKVINSGSGVTQQDKDDITAGVWSEAVRTLTSAGAGGATAQEVWEYVNRSLTTAAGVTAQDIADIADAIWEEQTADHSTVGTFGEQLSNISANVDEAAIAQAVWNEATRSLTVSVDISSQAQQDIAQEVWDYVI